MHRTRFWNLTLVLLLAAALLGIPASQAQSLDDLLEKAPPDTSVVDGPQSQGQSSRDASRASDEITVVTLDTIRSLPLTITPIAPFLSFLRQLIEDLIAWWTNAPATPASSSESTTEQPPVEPPSTGPVTTTPPETTETLETPAATPRETAIGAIFPAPPEQRLTGSQFMDMTENMTPAQREAEAVRVILEGHVPDFLRSFRPIQISMKISGQDHSAVLNVLPDYLAIGIDTDFIRMPLSPIGAQKIADRCQCLLPTSKMVDDIYAHATIQLNPQPMSGGQYPHWESRMRKNEFYREHHRLVEGQRAKTPHRLGEMLAGHKKDVLVSNFLDSHRANVVIYGWHDKRNRGRPIQGYGFGHENTYEDYSHGIRLISRTMTVDGQTVATTDILKDPVLHRLLSREGVVKDPRAIR